MLRIPQPTKRDFGIHLTRQGGKYLWCDADVHPIREQVDRIINDSEEPPIEWITLDNSTQIVDAYKALRSIVNLYRELGCTSARGQALGPQIPYARWRLICAVVEGLYGDRKFRAGQLWRKTRKELVAIAKEHRVRRYSRMRKHELVHTLVELGLGN